MAKVQLYLKLYLLLPSYTSESTALDVTLTNSSSIFDSDLLEGVVVDWDDTNTDSSTTPSTTYEHTYASDGAYNITVTFTDNTGRTEVQTLPVNVASAPSTGFNYDFNFNIE